MLVVNSAIKAAMSIKPKLRRNHVHNAATTTKKIGSATSVFSAARVKVPRAMRRPRTRKSGRRPPIPIATETGAIHRWAMAATYADRVAPGMELRAAMRTSYTSVGSLSRKPTVTARKTTDTTANGTHPAVNVRSLR